MSVYKKERGQIAKRDQRGGFGNTGFYRLRTNTFHFYTNLCALLRQRGIKIIIPVGDLLGPGQTVANYETNLTFAKFVAGRSAINQTVARYLQWPERR